MQHERRSNQQPIGAEMALAVGLSMLVVFVWVAHVGRAVANVLSGTGWQLPSVNDSFVSVVPVLGGDATAGLDPGPPSGSAASPGAVHFWVLVTEAVALVLAVLVARVAWRRWGPQRVFGVASRSDVDDLLGVARLRRDAPIIRPDLYGKERPR